MRERFKLIPAIYLVLHKGDKVLLHQRANTQYHNGEYGLVSGHMDGDELGTTAMIREAKEEAGIDLKPEDLKFVHLVHRLNRETGDEHIDIFYEAHKWTGEITNIEPHKCSDLSWFPIDNLPRNTIPLIKNVVTKIKNGEHYSEYEVEPK